MPDKMMFTDKFCVLDYGSHFELCGHNPGSVVIMNVDEMIELMDALERTFGHVRQQSTQQCVEPTEYGG